MSKNQKLLTWDDYARSVVAVTSETTKQTGELVARKGKAKRSELLDAIAEALDSMELGSGYGTAERLKDILDREPAPKSSGDNSHVGKALTQEGE